MQPVLASLVWPNFLLIYYVEWGGNSEKSQDQLARLYLNTGLGSPRDPSVSASQFGPGNGSLRPLLQLLAVLKMTMMMMLLSSVWYFWIQPP